MSIPPRKWIDWKQWKAIDKAFRQEDNRLLNNIKTMNKEKQII